MIARTLVIAALVGSIPVRAEAGAEVVLAPRPLPTESYGESFTAFLDLDDGTYALVQLVFTNAGLGDENAMCRVLVVPPGAPGVNRATKASRSGWRYERVDNMLRVAGCALAGHSEAIELSAKFDDLSVRARIRAPLERVRPPHHHITVNDRFQDSELLVGWASVEVELLVGSGPRRVLSGFAQVDHTRQDARIKDLATRWIRFRGLSSTKPLLIQLRVPREGERVEGWIWEGADPAPRALDPMGIHLALEGGRPKVKIADAGRELEIELLAPLFVYRPIEAYGFLGRLAKPWVGDPVNTTYRARVIGPKLEVRGTLEHQDLTR